jgi:hypothetical protein
LSSKLEELAKQDPSYSQLQQFTESGYRWIFTASKLTKKAIKEKGLPIEEAIITFEKHVLTFCNHVFDDHTNCVHAKTDDGQYTKKVNGKTNT